MRALDQRRREPGGGRVRISGWDRTVPARRGPRSPERRRPGRCRGLPLAQGGVASVASTTGSNWERTTGSSPPTRSVGGSSISTVGIAPPLGVPRVGAAPSPRDMGEKGMRSSNSVIDTGLTGPFGNGQVSSQGGATSVPVGETAPSALGAPVSCGIPFRSRARPFRSPLGRHGAGSGVRPVGLPLIGPRGRGRRRVDRTSVTGPASSATPTWRRAMRRRAWVAR